MPSAAFSLKINHIISNNHITSKHDTTPWDEVEDARTEKIALQDIFMEIEEVMLDC